MLDQEVMTRLREALLGDEAAVQLNAHLIEALHVWDDLIDQDVTLTAEDVSSAFRNALVLIPANSFYQRHFNELHPLLDVLILNWMTATAMERNPQSDLDLQVAFIIRSDYCNFLLKSMAIVGGFEHARRLWPEVRRFWHREGFDSFVQSLHAERAARGNG